MQFVWLSFYLFHFTGIISLPVLVMHENKAPLKRQLEMGTVTTEEWVGHVPRADKELGCIWEWAKVPPPFPLSTRACWEGLQARDAFPCWWEQCSPCPVSGSIKQETDSPVKTSATFWEWGEYFFFLAVGPKAVCSCYVPMSISGEGKERTWGYWWSRKHLPNTLSKIWIL